jgi:NAD(P)-dependent dehydrogenase (short-subunit alcohol dehydrogenase family)
MTELEDLFSLQGRVAVVTGATGTLGRSSAAGLAAAGAAVVVLSRDLDRAADLANELEGEAVGMQADVDDAGSLEAVRDGVLDRFGRLDILVTFAGGNLPAATRAAEQAPLDIPVAAVRDVLELNVLGTLLPIRVLGPAMHAAHPLPGGPSIVTVASVSAVRALTRVAAYSAAKAAVLNLTRGLAVELAGQDEGQIRVNALVPGFFVAEQNRSLLLAEDGTPTDRGRSVLARTPMGRFGRPAELAGALVWLCGPSAGFVTGTAVVVDGGFSADAGV